MKVRKQDIQFLLTILLAVVVTILLFKNPKQIYPVTKLKTIERRIEGKETRIQGETVVINHDKKIIAQLTSGLAGMQAELERIKKTKDTFRIVQIQDTMIHTLYQSGKFKDDVINRQDTVIVAQRYIINSKDTIITVQKADIKKLKKQRLGLMIYSGVMTGVAIIK